MKSNLYIIGLFVLLAFSCNKHENKKHNHNFEAPKVLENGNVIEFPNAESMKGFESETISSTDLDNEFIAPAKVAATVLNSYEGGQNIILFDDPNLADNYTNWIQTTLNIRQIENINIKQKTIEMERLDDLVKHGAATGKDLLDAKATLAMEKTNLANERASIIEHEAVLKAGGFQPEILRKAQSGTAYIICDIPENQISRISNGAHCDIVFTAYPNEVFKGKIDGVADMIDQVTRMFKLRVSITKDHEKLKSGMFANVKFKVDEGNNININKNAIITIQGENYVFIKTNDHTYTRRKVVAGPQIKDRIIIFDGLKPGEQVAVKSVMQLKGLSFGY